MDHILKDNTALLEDLKRDSTRMMDTLSKIAWDNKTHAAEIVEVIETHLQQVDKTTRKYMSEVRKTWFQHLFGRNMDDSDVTVDNNDHERVLSTSPQTSGEPGTGGDTTDLNTQLAASQIEPSVIVYSPELTEFLSTGSHNETGLADLEEKLITSFANRSIAWREGCVKNSYNYLLLDATVTNNLSSRMNPLGDEESLNVFVEAIFYVGKGKKSRACSHLRAAFRQMDQPKPEASRKVKRIQDIWNGKVGVAILHCFQYVIPVEAFTREACMIDAIGPDRLTNEKSGSYYSISEQWSETQRKKMGIYFLKKAFQIFQAEGAKPILPADMES